MLIDRLGRPIQVGDIVVTKPFASPRSSLTTKVLKINRSRVIVASNHRVWRKKHNPADGSWDWNIIKKDTLTRYPSEIIVVTEQLAYNKSTYPEYLI